MNINEITLEAMRCLKYEAAGREVRDSQTLSFVIADCEKKNPRKAKTIATKISAGSEPTSVETVPGPR